MISFLKKIASRILFFKNRNIENTYENYDFNKSNPLGGNGERVDIQLQLPFNFDNLDIYQKNHYKRYEFAKDLIDIGDVCGDFACGTGYGAVLISDKASQVIGADLDSVVISTIKERYLHKKNIQFLNINLLNLGFYNFFDKIISYETIEHFYEKDILQIFNIFFLALKSNGIFIFSTPYMQERSEAAEKLGFHLTFYLGEEKISKMLNQSGFELILFKFQNYETHNIENDLEKKDFIICVAKKV